MVGISASSNQAPNVASQETSKVPARRVKTHAKATRRTLTLLVLPSVAALLLINAYPLIYATVQSLHSGTLINAGKFVGLSNYSTVVRDPAFWHAVRFTVAFTLATVLGSWVIGLGLALALRTDLPGRGIFKVLLLLPWVVPVVISATSWNSLLATPQSTLPRLLGAVGLGHPLFLADPTLAKIAVGAFEVWLNFPFMMLMISAALESIDKTIYEAATVDGATGWQEFIHITLPLIARSTYISWLLMTIFVVNDFTTIFLLTGGGPVNSTTTVGVLAYRAAFENFQVGQGVAIAFLMSLSLIVISTILYRRIRKVPIG